MYHINDANSVTDHTYDLTYTEAALAAADEDGELNKELKEAHKEIKGLIGEGDVLRDKIEQVERQRRRTSARVERADFKQEGLLRLLWVACLTAASMVREAPVVQLVFAGGLGKRITPALEAQTEQVRDVVRTLEAQEVYAGPLRQTHAPALKTSAERAEALLQQRADEAAKLAALHEEARGWKARGNTLRVRLGGLLMARAVELELPAPKEYARGFFGRGRD